MTASEMLLRMAVPARTATTVLVSAGLLILAPSRADATENWPRKVSASYKIQLAGVKFGHFNFASSRNGAQYSVSSNAKLRAFFGAFKWRGTARSAGSILKSGPYPASYSYSAKKKKRTKSVAMTMAKRNVVALRVVPPVNPSKKRVPLRAQDKTNILDPMSAIIALTSPRKGANPCRQSVAIFDGKHRFDVHLSPKGARSIAGGSGAGFSRNVRVCRVRYVPISGHKTGKGNSYIVDAKAMEVWMVRSADGSMHVPYRIVVPTVLGKATLQATSINVEMADNRKLALNN